MSKTEPTKALDYVANEGSVRSQQNIQEQTNREDGQLGKIDIDPEVIRTIAGLAASEIKGVASLPGGVGDFVIESLGRKSNTKGIKVTINEKQVTILVTFVLQYGYDVPEVARKIQRNVKEAIEDMTDLEVVEVNIFVSDVIIVEEKIKEEVNS
jgi:uncharacterized alkaline shock family protein YloU